MLYFLLLFAALFGFWLLLSGYWANPLLLLLGLASSALAAWIGTRLEQSDTRGYSLRMLLRLPGYWVWLVGEIVKANLDVVRRVWRPHTYPISPVIGHLPLSQKTRLGKTIYANSITLTPGTVAIEVSDDAVMVHALSESAYADLAAGDMDRRVTWAEGRSG
ncbi:Na+/H+ antiporter subunit E [Thiorhodococcus minor]|uniref:Na+/H+ antiporter subunit E n=1 Tax=Thiorhodococcus minor TaxID=57489 RepID=A0A6M0JYS1_9GAMM|nr:Na+/H+ antiporter subunit E [Thiorhodococcus minor]NEV62640.1 Na+/H+ antiporter subunit E [Thiorhodococcus minor]